jgi:hypothetical protein
MAGGYLLVDLWNEVGGVFGRGNHMEIFCVLVTFLKPVRTGALFTFGLLDMG